MKNYKAIKKKMVSIVIATVLTVATLNLSNSMINTFAATVLQCGFEDGTDGFSARGTADTEVTSDYASSGSKSLFISGRTSAWCGAGVNMDSYMKAGSTYDISFAVMQRTGNDEEIKMSLQYDNTDGTTSFSEVLVSSVSSGKWDILRNAAYTVPTGASNLLLYVETPQNLIDIYIDDFEVLGSDAVSTKQGDADCNGKVNAADVLYLKKFLVNKNDSVGIGADYNFDKSVNAFDLCMLKRTLCTVQKTEDTIINNPIIWSDVPDNDVIRVGSYYYMVSTTMFFNPGVPVMRSTDLASWEIVSYVYDKLADSDKSNLTNGQNAYGKGQWATSLKYHDGKFYVFFASNDQGCSYIYQTSDIEKEPWTRSVINGIYHDASLLFDDDGKVYLIYGNGTIRAKQMNSTVTGFQAGGLDRVLYTENSGGLNVEGSRAYKINGYYYNFNISWPSGSKRTQSCWRSKSLTGTFEKKIIMCAGLCGYGGGVAQGSLVDTPDGKWYSILMQDHGAVGRIPVLIPVNWGTDNWPVFGNNGVSPETLTINTNYTGTHLAVSDEFNYSSNQDLALEWQWNHNPNNSCWSLTSKPGNLRLTTGNIVSNIYNARNTLTMRTEGPACQGYIKMDTTNMKAGDYAGLCAFQQYFGQVGVYADDSGKKYIFMANNGGNYASDIKDKVALNGNTIYVKIDFQFSAYDQSTHKMTSKDKSYFYYSYDGNNWTKIGSELSMSYELSFFTGYRFGIFNYATKNTGGYVDVDKFIYSHTEYQSALIK